MSIKKYLSKLFKPDYLRDAFYEESILGIAFHLIGNLLFHNVHKPLFKLKPYDSASFITGINRILFSPFIAAGIFFTCLLLSLLIIPKGIVKLVKGEYKEAGHCFFIEPVGALMALVYSTFMIGFAPVLNLTQFIMRSFHSLYVGVYNWYHRTNWGYTIIWENPPDVQNEKTSRIEQSKWYVDKFFAPMTNQLLQEQIPPKELVHLIAQYIGFELPKSFFDHSHYVLGQIYKALYLGETTVYKIQPKILYRMSFIQIKDYAKAHPNSRTSKAVDIFHNQWLSNCLDKQQQRRLTFKAIHEHAQARSGFFSTRNLAIGNKTHDVDNLNGNRSQLIVEHMP